MTTNTSEEWKKKFDNKYKTKFGSIRKVFKQRITGIETTGGNPTASEIKSFISTLLAAERDRVEKETVKLLWESIKSNDIDYDTSKVFYSYAKDKGITL